MLLEAVLDFLIYLLTLVAQVVMTFISLTVLIIVGIVCASSPYGYRPGVNRVDPTRVPTGHPGETLIPTSRPEEES